MEQRLIPSDIANLLSERRSETTVNADTYVREFFRIIEEALRSDSIVKIKGLGTFKLVRVEARESVNINTGQRFTIEEHTKVSFTPDTTLRNLINKPFSEFETVVLGEDVDIDELDNIGREIADDNYDYEGDETDQIEQTEQFETTTLTEQEENAEPEAVESVVEISTEDTTDEEQTESEEPETEEPEIEKTESEPVQTVATQYVTDMTVTNQHVEHQTITTPEKMEHNTSARLSIWEALALMIFILALMALSYMAGYNHWLLMDTPATVETVQPSAKPSVQVQPDTLCSKDTTTVVGTPTDTVSGKKPIVTPVKPAKDPSADFPQIEGAPYVIVGIEAEHAVKIGDSLRGLSLKYYGSKDYVKYIVLLNEIKNPDILNVGMVLRIPKLEKRN